MNYYITAGTLAFIAGFTSPFGGFGFNVSLFVISNLALIGYVTTLIRKSETI